MKMLKKYAPWGLCCLLAAALAGSIVLNLKTARADGYVERDYTHYDVSLAETEKDSISFIEGQQLPALSRMSAEDQREYIEPLQVMERIARLGLLEEDFLYPERDRKRLYASRTNLGTGFESEVFFEGTTSAELNEFLSANAGASVQIIQDVLYVSEPIRIPDNTELAGNGVCLEAASQEGDYSTPLDGAAVYLESGKSISISGIHIDGGFTFGIFAIDSDEVRIDNCVIEAVSCKPIVLMGTCNGFSITGNRLCKNLSGGLYLTGDVSNGLVEGNVIKGNFGSTNLMAGIVMIAIDTQEGVGPYTTYRPYLYFPEEQKLHDILSAPHKIIIRNNVIANNNSSGIYSYGAYLNYITENQITGNEKEGICLDYGTVGSYVAYNDITANGNRNRMSDSELKLDFVLELGRLEDGTSPAKLPGISIDNSAYNIVFDNRIIGNYGSGVKMVRTGVRNIISSNLIQDNNAGRSGAFHFFGVELGYAAADYELDNLDIKPEYENIICRNMITGGHYAGIFLAEEVYMNDFFDNVILDATDWSMESLSQKHNSTVNNLSQQPSRGISLSGTNGSAIVLPEMVD